VQRTNMEPYIDTANDQLLLIGLIETPDAASKAKEIAREPIDVFCIGRADLSLKMGYPYAPRHPAVAEVTKRALSDVMEAGKTAGVLAYDVEEAEDWIRFGCRFVIYSQPEMILARHYRDAIAAIKHLPQPVWDLARERSGADRPAPPVAVEA